MTPNPETPDPQGGPPPQPVPARRLDRFVRPDVVVLPLGGGDTITVRRRLNAGEQRAMFARMYYAGVTGLRTNPFQQGIATVLAYLLDWTVVDAQGAPVPIKDQPLAAVSDALDALEPDEFAEIKEAIEQHQDRMDAERAAAKKARDGGTPSSATSPSPGTTAGATNG